MIQKQIQDEIDRQVSEALNERDIEIISTIKQFKIKNRFPDSEVAQEAFCFACDEIIKLIESEG